ncbi:MAG TPA: YhjD/YihY/BrkB family envelope integrity protein [Bacteroidales bacterium]|nr:YhjD/YihY/BrkB family envelope integrity protein [Bacteroidales bacterium]
MKSNIFTKARRFFEKDIWDMSTKDRHPVLSFLIRQGRILFIALKGFNKDKIQLRSSALSFYTMLSIVPILALVFGVAKGFGLDQKLTVLITTRLQEHKEVMNSLLDFVDKYLVRINSGAIAGIGLVILFWSVMKVFANIENSFNNIWQVKKSRMLARQFTDYISLLIIAPVFFIISSSINVAKLPEIWENIKFLSYLDTVLKILVAILSYTLIWFVFTLIYIVVPNTKVKFVPALVAGIITGTLFQLVQWAYVNFQSLLTSYGAIYGTFAALPLFMIWLEWSWLIVLFGAEISFAYQNAAHYEREAEEVHVSHKNKRVLALLVTHKIVNNFMEQNDPLDAAEIADQLNIPVRIVRELLYELQNARIITETLTLKEKEIAYQPALDPSKITISFVIDTLEKQGNQIPFEKETSELVKINSIVESFYTDIGSSKNNTALKDI